MQTNKTPLEVLREHFTIGTAALTPGMMQDIEKAMRAYAGEQLVEPKPEKKAYVTAPPNSAEFKTYIWESEYEVYIANAWALDHAKFIIQQEFYQWKVEQNILNNSAARDPKWIGTLLPNAIKEIVDLTRLLDRETPTILKPGQGECSYHANE